MKIPPCQRENIQNTYFNPVEQDKCPLSYLTTFESRGIFVFKAKDNVSEVEPSSEASEKLVHFIKNQLINVLTSI